VHDRLKQDEIGQDTNNQRDINFTHTSGDITHVVDQHAALIIKATPSYYWMDAQAYGGPGTPKDVQEIRIRPGIDPGFFSLPDSRLTYKVVAAHELLHDVNVKHHGAGDQRVLWKAGKDAHGNPAMLEFALDDNGNATGTGTPIEVYSEDGQ